LFFQRTGSRGLLGSEIFKGPEPVVL